LSSIEEASFDFDWTKKWQQFATFEVNANVSFWAQMPSADRARERLMSELNRT
jgi:hypothetical protein